ncbi:GRIP and coiled-coil domain-containing protein 2-like [Tigriopus californicus]|uniref:GRIP and coiled-coil domain-containing protein 2-like n=1 Tax=Tigriopus californicus TaxID=6832 RepID=UPI0027DAA5F1|nr:GRIP and coiled-coil domain-containing protein 2-like [Tigriopus californicus]
MALSFEELAAVFQICDVDNKGFICAKDLVRVSAQFSTSSSSPSSSNGIEQVISLLQLEDHDELDFGQFCTRVQQVLKHSPLTRDALTLEASGEGFPVERTTRSHARRNLFDAMNSFQSPPIVDDVHRSLKKIQRQLLEMRDASLDSKSEILSLMKETSKRHEDEFNRRVLQIQNLYEEKLMSEQKHMEDLLRMDERDRSAQLDKMDDDKKAMLVQLHTLKDQVKGQAKEEASKHCSELKVSNCILEEKVKILEEKVLLESENNVRVKREFEAERDRFDEERLSLSFEKASFSSEKDEFRAVLHSLLQQIMDQKAMSEQNVVRLSEPLSPRFDLAVEMLENDNELLAKVESLTAENQELKDRIENLVEQKEALQEQLERVRNEREDFRKSFRSLECAKTEESRSLIQQFTGALHNSKMKTRLKELDQKLSETNQRMEAQKSSYSLELNALRVSLINSRNALQMLQSEKEGEINDLKLRLREGESELKCVKEAAGFIQASQDDKRCLSILVDDIGRQQEAILTRLEALENRRISSKATSFSSPDVLPC